MYVLSLPQAGHILGDSGYRPVLINFANECLGMSRHWHFLSGDVRRWKLTCARLRGPELRVQQGTEQLKAKVEPEKLI